LDKHREHSSQRGKFKLILNVKPKSQPWSQLIAKKAKAAGDWPELWARTASCQSSARFGSVYSFRPYSQPGALSKAFGSKIIYWRARLGLLSLRRDN